jgi:hypothetical protein
MSYAICTHFREYSKTKILLELLFQIEIDIKLPFFCTWSFKNIVLSSYFAGEQAEARLVEIVCYKPARRGFSKFFEFFN